MLYYLGTNLHNFLAARFMIFSSLNVRKHDAKFYSK